MTLLYPVLCVPKTSCEVRRRVRGRVSFSRAGVLPSCPVPGSGLWSWGAGLARERLSQWAAGPGARERGPLGYVRALWAPRPGSQGQSRTGRARPGQLKAGRACPARLPRGPSCKARAPGYKRPAMEGLTWDSALAMASRERLPAPSPRGPRAAAPALRTAPGAPSPQRPLGPAPWEGAALWTSAGWSPICNWPWVARRACGGAANPR